jgi:Undecaprenyl-phosphate galactose phosphotransferase WbaP
MAGKDAYTQRDFAADQRAFSRRVGLRYSIQVILNSLPLLAVDVLSLTATIAACRIVAHQFGLHVGVDVSDFLIPITAGFILLNFELGLYPGVRLSPVEELRRLVVSVTCMFVIWIVGLIVTQGSMGTWWFLLTVYIASLLVLPIGRSWVRHFLGRWTRWGMPALVCGDDEAAPRVYQWLVQNHHLGLRPVGVIGNRDGLDVGPDDNWYAGGWDATPEVAHERGVFWAVVVPPESQSVSISSLISDHLYTIPQVHVLSELTGLPDHWNPQQLDGLSGIHLQQNLMLPLPKLIKRCFDLAASLAGCLVLLPVFFYLAVAVKMSSRGPILYSQARVGRYGRTFRAWKFRTMFQNSDALLEEYLENNPDQLPEWNRNQKLRSDPRITRIGRFLRKTSLDELPQLWNVIWGDMSLVGPRPMLPSQVAQYGNHFGLYSMVRPGITGLWQVSGRNEKTFEERAQLDAYYVRNWSPWVDLYLLIKTIRIVLFAKGAY